MTEMAYGVEADYDQPMPVLEGVLDRKARLVDWLMALYLLTVGVLQATPYWRGSTYIAYAVPVILLIQLRTNRASRIPELWFFLAMMAWIGFTTAIATFRLASAITAWYLIKIYIMAVFLIIVCDSLPKLLLLMRAIVLGGTVVVLVGVVAGLPSVIEGGERIGGIAENPNASAAIVLFTGLAGLMTLPFSGKLWKTYIWALLALSLVALLGTGTRTAIICLAVVSLAYVLFEYGRHMKEHWKVIVPIVAIMILVPYIAIRYFGDSPALRRMGDLIGQLERGRGAAADSRMQIYIHGWHLFLSHPLVGIGAGTYRFYGPGGLAHTHTTFLELLVTNGVPGFLLYVGLIAGLWLRLRRLVRIFRHDRKMRNGLNAARAFVVAVVAHGMLSTTYQSKFAIFALAVLIGFSARLLHAVRQEEAYQVSYEESDEPASRPAWALPLS